MLTDQQLRGQSDIAAVLLVQLAELIAEARSDRVSRRIRHEKIQQMLTITTTLIAFWTEPRYWFLRLGVRLLNVVLRISSFCTRI